MQEQEYQASGNGGGGNGATTIVPLTAEQMGGVATPLAGTGLPAGFNSSSIYRDPAGGRVGVYPMVTVGTFVLPSGSSLAAGNNINLCWVPAQSILTNFVIVNSGLAGTLQDNLATPTVYCTTSGAVSNMANMTATQAQNLGTMYANTPRAIGANGCAVVQWQKGTLLQLVLTGTPSYTTPVVFMIEWSPVYDGGV
jgi:hypothetical protein